MRSSPQGMPPPTNNATAKNRKMWWDKLDRVISNHSSKGAVILLCDFNACNSLPVTTSAVSNAMSTTPNVHFRDEVMPIWDVDLSGALTPAPKRLKHAGEP